MVLAITIFGRPMTKKNSRQHVMVRGRMIPIASKPYREWEQDALKQITGQMRKKIDYPVNVAYRIFPWRDGMADLAGYIQAGNDMLVKAGVLKDDSGWRPKIVARHDGSEIVAVDKAQPRMEILITSIP